MAENEKTVRVYDEDQVIENIEIEEFQVVRREYFAHLFEPAVSIKVDSITFNSACIRRFPNVQYVQLLINPEQKRLVIKPCNEDAKDAIKWCNIKNGKQEPRTVNCKIFGAKLFDMQKWVTNCRYKLLGLIAKTNDEQLVAFSLEDTEVYPPKEVDEEGKVKKAGRKAYYPEAWRDSFGLPVAEHDDKLKIDILTGYARFEVVTKKDNVPSSQSLNGEQIAVDLDKKEV